MELRKYLDLVASRKEDEGDRIAWMKELLIASQGYTDEERHQIGGVLTEIIESQDEDVVLRQHAADEIGYYLETPTPRLLERFYDSDEDVDVRYNLHSSFKTVLPIDALKSTNPNKPCVATGDRAHG